MLCKFSGEDPTLTDGKSCCSCSHTKGPFIKYLHIQLAMSSFWGGGGIDQALFLTWHVSKSSFFFPHFFALFEMRRRVRLRHTSEIRDQTFLAPFPSVFWGNQTEAWPLLVTGRFFLTWLLMFWFGSPFRLLGALRKSKWWASAVAHKLSLALLGN